MTDDPRAIWKAAECWRSCPSVRPKNLPPAAPPCRSLGCHRPASRKGAWQWRPPLPSTPCRFERTGVAGQWTVTLEKATHQPLARLEQPCCAGPSQRSPALSRGRPARRSCESTASAYRFAPASQLREAVPQLRNRRSGLVRTGGGILSPQPRPAPPSPTFP